MDTLAVQRAQDVIDRENSELRPSQKLLTAERIADRCDLPVSTVYQMARENRIGGVVRLGRRVRFDPVKFEAWLEAGGEALPGGWRQEAV